jgi:DNA-binding NarL/FixJ family response regulator
VAQVTVNTHIAQLGAVAGGGSALLVSIQDLNESIRLVRHGYELTDPDDIATLTPSEMAPVAGTADEAVQSAGELSLRERAVLELVAAGRTNVAIAHELGISPRTVAKHLEHLYRKLGVANRAAAVARRPGDR